MLLFPEREEERAPEYGGKEQRMKEMNKTYAIVEVIEGEQIQLVRYWSSNFQPRIPEYTLRRSSGGGVCRVCFFFS